MRTPAVSGFVQKTRRASVFRDAARRHGLRSILSRAWVCAPADGGRDGRASAGPSPGAPGVGEESRLHGRGRSHPGPRHRSEHRDLHPDGPGPPAAAPGQGPVAAGGSRWPRALLRLEPQPQRHRDPLVAPDVRAHPRREFRVRRRPRPLHDPGPPHRGRTDGQRGWRPGVRHVLRGAGACSHRGPALHRRGRSDPGRPSGGRARPRLLDAPLRGRPQGRGADGAGERPGDDRGRGGAPRLPRRRGRRIHRRLRSPDDAGPDHPHLESGPARLARPLADVDGTAQGWRLYRTGHRRRQRPLPPAPHRGHAAPRDEVRALPGRRSSRSISAFCREAAAPRGCATSRKRRSSS